MKRNRTIIVFLSIAGLALASRARSEVGPSDPESRATELIAAECLGCHNSELATSGLDLTQLETALRGGDHGPALVPGHPESSLLWSRVSSGEMPPGSPLSAADREVFRDWIAAGAAWDRPIGSKSPIKRSDSNWWSFQPLRKPQPPSPDTTPEHWQSSPIDRFVYARMREAGLDPSPPAGRRTLIRRAGYDLIGLPPSFEEISAFLDDSSPAAYEKLIDRLLASPRYGERWGRHWLDVVRFAESEGFERDTLRENAWPYRDYVIGSFNQDKPYLDFAREQIAGDVLAPVTRDGVVATGFLVSGPSDTVGLMSSVPVQREMVRQEQMEEMIGTVSQTFLGLTVNCARCHDHKYDPIPQREYYRMKAAFDGVWQGDRDLLTPGEQQARGEQVQSLEGRIAELEDRLASIELPARRRVLSRRSGGPANVTAPSPIARWTFDLNSRDSAGSLHIEMSEKVVLAEGRLRVAAGTDAKVSAAVKTVPLPRELREKTIEAWFWLNRLPEELITAVQIHNTEALLGAVKDGIMFSGGDSKEWVNSSSSSFRTADGNGTAETGEAARLIHIAICYAADHSIRLYRDGKPYGEAYTPDIRIPEGRLQTYLAGEARVAFNVSKDLELEEARLYDVALTEDQVEASYRGGAPNVRQEELDPVMTSAERSRALELRAELKNLRARREAIPDPQRIYAADVRQPGSTWLLERGDPNTKLEKVSAGGLSCIPAGSPEFGLEVDAPEADRRIRLAEWLANPRNPIFARTMVNRVWHYLFGRGLVENPNDLGFNGGQPTHPELLDWLAGEFIRGGWSVKNLHRLIMTSQTYRQASAWRAAAAEIDAGNRLLWRYAPRRLEGEAIRDAMLLASGQVNWEMGGPSFRPFRSEEKPGAFEMYTQVDADEPALNRRSVYRMSVVSAPSPLLDSFDCPNPNVKTPKRVVTTTALQALSLMNNAFVLRQARAFAGRVERESESGREHQVRRAFRIALGRSPGREESRWSEDLVGEHGLSSLCWGLFNTSEFLYVN
ncbi:MAG: DUF1553 domain-containing protein [Acidobacteriota bacterium]|nr:DUF1553 domain-containing protein [Acidobacteriota bacterium]